MNPAVDGGRDLVIESAKGPIRARLHESPGAQSGIVWVFGAGGGLGGPAGGIYERLGSSLHTEGIRSLQVAYRHPAVLAPCIADTWRASHSFTGWERRGWRWLGIHSEEPW